MVEVISVRFRGGCKAYFFDPQGVSVQEGDEVIVETAQGAEFGTCVCGNHSVEDHAVIQPLRPMHRLATEEDRKVVARNRKREKEAFAICEKKIAEHKLEMKLVNVECGFEGNKIIFFFTADGRVDFRELVKDLAGIFRARIELRQIGVRDEAKMLGGLGICGQPFCCKRFLDDFQPVSIKMAKTQNLSLNPTKISGSCGRLMCCLKYEQFAYEDAQKRMPKNDSFVQTPDGPGNISAVNLVRETVTVRLDEMPESPKTYSVEEVIVLRNGKGSRDGIDIPERPAHIEKEPQLDQFGMELPEKQPSIRQFRNAPPKHREGGEEKREKSRHENQSAPKESGKAGGKEAAAAAEKNPVKDAEKSKNTERPNTRRGHRGGRGRRGGENKEAVRQKQDKAEKIEKVEKAEKGEKKEPKAAAQPRPVRFGSSMPIANNAVQTERSGKSAQKNPKNKGRRTFHKNRGPRGGNKPAQGKQEN